MKLLPNKDKVKTLLLLIGCHFPRTRRLLYYHLLSLFYFPEGKSSWSGVRISQRPLGLVWHILAWTCWSGGKEEVGQQEEHEYIYINEGSNLQHRSNDTKTENALNILGTCF